MQIVEQTFVKYPSIENSYRELFINKIREQYPDACKMPWAITEKIHGTNVQISLDNENNVSFGKRTGFLEKDEKFYNLPELASQYIEDVKLLKAAIDHEYKMASHRVTLYGELYGGSYPHKDVVQDNKSSKVQKGVFYSPKNHIMFFDCFVEISQDAPEKSFFLPVNAFEPLMFKTNLPFQVSTIVANLDEALKYPNDAPSRIYIRHHLPQLPDNIEEGIVIKPHAQSLFVGCSRVVLKSKNDRFAEIQKEKKEHTQKKMEPKLQEVYENMLSYITENRLRNVVSHMGEVSIKDLGRIIGEFSHDVIQDFNKDTGKLNELEKADQKSVTKQLNPCIVALVKGVLLKEL